MKHEILEDTIKAFLQTTLARMETQSGQVEQAVNKDTLAAQHIVYLMDLGAKISKGSSVLFKSMQHGNAGSPIAVNSLGVRLLDILRTTDFDALQERFPLHVFNPLLKTMIDLAEKLGIVDEVKSPYWQVHSDGTQRLVTRLNGFVTQFRSEVKSRAFKTRWKNYLRRSRKNERELRNLIDGVFRAYAKVMVVRIDLSYKKKVGIHQSDQAEVGLADLKTHREKLLKKMRATFGDGFVTYAWKLEYGLIRGHHLHALFFFDGAKLRQDVVIGKMIGDIWDGIATEGNGSHFNCNAHKVNYKNPCIGVLSHRDTEAVKALKEVVATYMTKVDLFMQIDADKGYRAFGKGAIPQPNPKGVGRPRVHAQGHADQHVSPN